MKLTLPRLSIQKGSSISARIPIELEDGETLLGFRAGAYIKAMLSDSKILCVLDAKVNADKSAVDISVGPPRSEVIPAGQLVYYVEMAKGLNTKIVEKSYLNVEP